MRHQSTNRRDGLDKRCKKLAFLVSATAAVLGNWCGSTAVATTYTWANAGTDWGTAADWTPSAVPTSADTALFIPQPVASTPMNPNLGAAESVGSLLVANNPSLGNYTFLGNNALTIATQLTIRGAGTTTFNGPTIAGTAIFNIGFDAGLDLTGSSVATANAGQINVYGSLVLDNTTTNTLARLATTNTIVTNGGSLSVLGNIAGGVVNVGTLSVTAGATTPGEGADTISVSAPNGASAASVLNFANSGTYNLRTTTGVGYDFVGIGGALGSASGPQITFTSAPTIASGSTLGANGMFVGSNTATSSTVGFAIATDTTGVGWATYVTPSGGTGGVEILASTAVTNATQFNALGVTSNANLTIPGSTTVSAGSPAVSIGALELSPSGAGSTLDLTNGGSGTSIKTNAILLAGSNDFTIAGTSASTLDGSGTKNIWVANPATTLFISALLDGTGSVGNPIDVQGPGFVSLTGTYNQVTITGTNRLNLINGTFRANQTQFAMAGATAAVVAFRGGVLEIAGGSDGTGATADFTRAISSTNTAGGVNWYSTTSGDLQGGSGGFSAFGSAASVDIGGAANTPLSWGVGTVTTNGTGFVQDGEALIFGSVKSNARLDFLNNIILDGGGASIGPYAAREIKVIGGAGGDSTNLAGVISGSSATDLLKTGTGTLALTGANTYSGATLISAGSLTLDNTKNANAGIAGTSAVTIASGATLRLLSSVANNGGGTTTLINDNAVLSVVTGASVVLDLKGSTEAIGEFVVNGVIQPTGVYSQTVEPAGASGDEAFFTNAGSAGDSITVGVPEPASLGLLALGGLCVMRRRRRRQ